MKYHWTLYDNGASIEKEGSEGGLIIRDEENTFGARVTLENKGNIAPFSISLGIYGLMFHTDFFSTEEHAQKCFDQYKTIIDKIIVHYSLDENNRDINWSDKLQILLNELITVN